MLKSIFNLHQWRKLTLLIVIITGILVPTILITPVYGEDCEKISDMDDKAECYARKAEEKESEYESTSKKLQDIRNLKNDISSEITKLASELNVTQDQMDNLQNQINLVVKDLEEINEGLTDRKGKLSEKTQLRNTVLRTYSKNTVMNDLEVFMGISRPGNLTGFQFNNLTHAYNTALTDEAIRIIKGLNLEIDSFEADKNEGEKLKNELIDTQNSLLALKKDLDNKKAQAQNELNTAQSQETNYEGKLQNLQKEIDELNSKQKDILKQKYGDEYGSVGEYDTPGSSTPKPPFKPAFAAFSYGAYTHYKGMSQYGAKGRAEDGQSYKDIIEFYYDTSVKEKDLDDEICVEGYGDMKLQKYLYGLGEMPSTWPADALKAQAVAARSYANRYIEQDKCICTTQSCQVFVKSKSDNPPTSWKKAVDDTDNEVLSDSGTVAYYSSTTGGYIDGIGWDIDGGKWPGNAYEKKAESPWFYKAWYTKSYSSNDTCGHGHPWLTEKEMADILNAWVVWNKGSSSDRDHISPVTTSCWGGDPYSLDEMADKADDYGSKYSSVNSVDVDISSGGYTSKVIFSTDKGTVSIDGNTFKTVFNLRAPGYLSIRSKLFDLQQED